METLTLLLVADSESAWTLSSRDVLLHGGIVDTIDLGAFLDGLIRTVHRSGRRLRVLIMPGDGDFGSMIARATVARIAGIYDQVEIV